MRSSASCSAELMTPKHAWGRGSKLRASGAGGGGRVRGRSEVPPWRRSGDNWASRRYVYGGVRWQPGRRAASSSARRSTSRAARLRCRLGRGPAGRVAGASRSRSRFSVRKILSVSHTCFQKLTSRKSPQNQMLSIWVTQSGRGTQSGQSPSFHQTDEQKRGQNPHPPAGWHTTVGHEGRDERHKGCATRHCAGGVAERTRKRFPSWMGRMRA